MAAVADELYPLSADALCLGPTSYHLSDDPEDLEPGTIAKVRFPVAIRLDRPTPDGRYIASEGFSMRPGPWSIMYQDKVAPAHDNARLAGSLREMTVVDNVGSGWGFLADLPAGHEAKVAMRTRSIRGVSADLTAVHRELPTAELEALGVREVAARSTFSRLTMVTVPAFPDAFGELVPASGEPELLASARYFTDTEIVRPDWWFAQPTFAGPTSVRVEGDRVWGHIWSRSAPCHRSYADRCELPPLDDDFADFHKSRSVLLESGQYAATGRVFFVTTHQRGLAGATPEQINLAYDHTGSCWADVCAGYDQWGIWIAGALRPGLGPNARYALRASPLSGHWSPSTRRNRRGKRSLMCVLSVNSNGFEIDEYDDGTLVASGPPPGALLLTAPTETVELAVDVVEHELEDHLIDGEPATGAMIALLPDQPDDFALDGQEPPGALHVTLRYLGDADLWAEEARAELADRVGAVLEGMQAPVSFSVSGVGLLGDNGAGVLFLNGAVDGLRAEVAAAASAVAERHGVALPADHPNFLPHMTLRWDGVAPPPEMQGRTITASTVRLVFATEASDYDLTSTPDLLELAATEDAVTAPPAPFVAAIGTVDPFAPVAVKPYTRNGRPVVGYSRAGRDGAGPQNAAGDPGATADAWSERMGLVSDAVAEVVSLGNLIAKAPAGPGRDSALRRFVAAAKEMRRLAGPVEKAYKAGELDAATSAEYVTLWRKFESDLQPLTGPLIQVQTRVPIKRWRVMPGDSILASRRPARSRSTA